jgi:hypothetical protein
MAIRASEAQGAGRMHGRLVALCVAGNASSAFAIRVFLRLAQQIRASPFVRCTQRRRGDPRGQRGEEQARGQRGPRREARNAHNVIAICHPAIHSAFSNRID